jgi:hypothetical protein
MLRLQSETRPEIRLQLDLWEPEPTLRQETKPDNRRHLLHSHQGSR